MLSQNKQDTVTRSCQTFQSHIVNDWESFSPIVIANEATEESFVQPINDRAASFRSHISDAPIDNLIEF